MSSLRTCLAATNQFAPVSLQIKIFTATVYQFVKTFIVSLISLSCGVSVVGASDLGPEGLEFELEYLTF